jgi:hypothetical protein
MSPMAMTGDELDVLLKTVSSPGSTYNSRAKLSDDQRGAIIRAILPEINARIAQESAQGELGSPTHKKS